MNPMRTRVNCWKCGALSSDAERKLSFRAVCESCGSGLHCCRNCKYYAPGRPNDCAVPGTEFIADREANNFCEEFSMLVRPPSEPNRSKKPFDDLFK